jgi:hypothetical protein
MPSLRQAGVAPLPSTPKEELKAPAVELNQKLKLVLRDLIRVREQWNNSRVR